MEKLSISEIAAAVKGDIYNCGCPDEYFITSVSTDSRKNASDALFIPIRGEFYDGHDFLDSAFENGAAACISERLPEEGRVCVKVSSTAQAIKDLAEYYKSKFQIKTVAITGSVGKTTTKDMIASVLGQKYKVLKTEGNFNNEIGLPLTVFKLNSQHECLVLEMGMNMRGEIHNLSRIARPDICVITNVGVSHIENLGSVHGIFEAKCEIFDFMNPDGWAVLNGDDEMFSGIENKRVKRILKFGVGKRNGVRAENIVVNGIDGVSFTACYAGQTVEINIPTPGSHMVLNALASVACGFLLGVGPEDIKLGVENYVPSKMRMDIIKTGGCTLINDVYNASPSSMKAALDILAATSGRKVAFLGDMFELGQLAPQLHAEVGEYAVDKNIDWIFFIGKRSRDGYEAAMKKNSNSQLRWYETIESLLPDMGEILHSGDFVLVKASRAMRFERIVRLLTDLY